MKKSVIENILWMLRHRHEFVFTGSALKDVEYKVDAIDGLSAYHRFESEGKLLPTKHPNILKTLLRIKASINFQIKEWAESRADGTLPKFEFNKIIKEMSLPEWVVRATENQKGKFYNPNSGWLIKH